ncbi:hypothetical protein E4T49_02812, partial [Aureobasidium sp. EXF-10728]
FARTEEFRLDAERKKILDQWFPHTPAIFWSETCVDHNGFFGSHTSRPLEPSPASSFTDQTAHSTATDDQEVVSTYFRLIVKILESPDGRSQSSASSTSSKAKYRWHEMGFMSCSSGTKSMMLSFNVPDSVITDLHKTLPTNSEQIKGPYGLHIPLLEELVKLYDRSIWAMAKKVRDIEKQRLEESVRRGSTTPSHLDNRSPRNEPGKPTGPVRTTENFEYLFEISRHLAHSVETTQIATEVVERMKCACDSLLLVLETPILRMRVQRLDFLHSLLRGLSARSVSNEKRLTSEQVLLSNMISQRDSKVNKDMSSFSSEIALATKADGAAMKTIALVTLTFLPATFALLGMNFFTVDSKTPGGRLTSTKDLWIYFVIAVPLTSIVLCFWWWWQTREEKKAELRNNQIRREGDIEKAGS